MYYKSALKLHFWPQWKLAGCDGHIAEKLNNCYTVLAKFKRENNIFWFNSNLELKHFHFIEKQIYFEFY